MPSELQKLVGHGLNLAKTKKDLTQVIWPLQKILENTGPQLHALFGGTRNKATLDAAQASYAKAAADLKQAAESVLAAVQATEKVSNL